MSQQSSTMITLSSLTWIDYTVIGLIFVSVLISLIRGFVREVLSLVTWIVAFVIAFRYGDALGNMFQHHISSPTARFVVGAAILFIATLIVGAIVNYIIATLVDKTGLSGTDRMLGVLLGAARGVLIVAVLMALATYTAIPQDDAWTKSLVLPHLQGCVNWIKGFMPEALNFFDEKSGIALALTNTSATTSTMIVGNGNTSAPVVTSTTTTVTNTGASAPVTTNTTTESNTSASAPAMMPQNSTTGGVIVQSSSHP